MSPPRRRDRKTIPLFEEEPPAQAHPPIEPGRPRLEHAAFVVLGVVLTIAVFLRGLGFL